MILNKLQLDSARQRINLLLQSKEHANDPLVLLCNNLLDTYDADHKRKKKLQRVADKRGRTMDKIYEILRLHRGEEEPEDKP